LHHTTSSTTEHLNKNISFALHSSQPIKKGDYSLYACIYGSLKQFAHLLVSGIGTTLVFQHPLLEKLPPTGMGEKNV
jgi:hypothetical protein